MRSRWRSLILVVVVCGPGCGPSTTWDPKNPEAEYSRLVKAASRVPTPADACESSVRTAIGDISAEGEPDEVIGAIATEAAERGGTHYVVRGDEKDRSYVTSVWATKDTAYATTTPKDSRRTWAVVYRCE